MDTELDHLIWGVPDLDDGIREIERRTGVRAAYGGRHHGVGTHNAVLGLGGRTYLEILAPDPNQTRFSSFGALVRDLREPKLLSWALRTTDVRARSEVAQREGLRPGVVLSMSRRMASGTTLSWRFMQVEGHDFGPLMPFMIEWRCSEHPSRQSPTGCELQTLSIESPDAPKLKNHLAILGMTQEVQAATRADLRAEISAPTGSISLN
ncbi:MAG: VOC family protein [Thermoanaerobaculia bacterium]|nr:VOC family protein [Thermoanaerobaculia bacterium]